MNLNGHLKALKVKCGEATSRIGKAALRVRGGRSAGSTRLNPAVPSQSRRSNAGRKTQGLRKGLRGPPFHLPRLRGQKSPRQPDVNLKRSLNIFQVVSTESRETILAASSPRDESLGDGPDQARTLTRTDQCRRHAHRDEPTAPTLLDHVHDPAHRDKVTRERAHVRVVTRFGRRVERQLDGFARSRQRCVK